MADFDTAVNIKPIYGQVKNQAPKQSVVALGDGYEHRLTVGLQQNPKVYNLTFVVSQTEAEVIDGFLRSRKFKNESFTYTPEGEGFTKTGTYVQNDGSDASASGTVITATVNNHGLSAGDTITVDFTSGATDGTYTVQNDTGINTFTLTASAANITSTALSITKSGQGKYKCDSWSISIPYNNRCTVTTTFIEVFEP
jgi:phage-related protein